MEIGGNDQEDRFFDSKEDVTSPSDSGSDCADGLDSNGKSFDLVSGNFRYEVWMETPRSVRERRNKFLKWMDIASDSRRLDGSGSVYLSGEIGIDVDRVSTTSGAVLRNADHEKEFSSSQCPNSTWSSNAANLSLDGFPEENLFCRIKNLDDGTEFVVDELGQDGTVISLRELGSDRLFTIDEFERTLGLSPSVQQFVRRKVIEANQILVKKARRRRRWWRRLGAVICAVDRQWEEGRLEPGESDTGTSGKVRKVKVHSHKKRLKELSALYMEQEIQAHKGLILTMKFSPDAQFLASAGEDRIVRVWQVTVCKRTNDDGIPELDSSCSCFTLNGSELSPFCEDKDRKGKFASISKARDSACIIFPTKTCRISQKPFHEFHGHCGNVLDLSWSSKKYLLSSSEDKTVRLWKMGCNSCLKVFSHSNYVTSVQFNPVDDNYFISGSIDGKVRIWVISGCQVVDWTDIKEMATAVCYCPDGQGVIVGSMTGDCRFYDASGNHLRLNAQVCLQGKKKSPSNRIIGFQFSPSDPGKVMAVSADSHIRILNGVEVICKYKGNRNSSQMSASFTSDGRHIISASETSNVCFWNYSPNGPVPQQSKIIKSCERFSCNALVAIPWSGMKSETLQSNEQVSKDFIRNSENVRLCWKDLSHNSLVPLSSQNGFSLSHEFFSEALPKGSATWPEEKLPTSSSLSSASAICKSQFEHLKSSCHNMVTSHGWGLVIVTAGWDGWIRSFRNYGLPVRLQ